MKQQLDQFFNAPILVATAAKLKAVGIIVTPPQVLVFGLGILMIPICIICFFVALRSRGRIRASDHPGATGRFATDKEVYADFSMPSVGRHYAHWMIFGTIALVAIAEGVYFAVHRTFFIPAKLVLFSAALSGAFAYVNVEHYQWFREKVKKHNFFQMGRYKWRRVGLDIKGRFEGILVPGPTGSGKTSRFLINNIIGDADGNASAVVLDRKTDEDIADIVGYSWVRRGKQVVYFNPYKWKMKLNPLWLIKPDFTSQETFDQIKEIIESIFGSYFANVGEMKPDTDHFIGREYRLICATLKAILLLPLEYRNLPMLLDAMKQTPEELQRFIASTGNEHVIDEFRFFANANRQEQINAMQGMYRKLQFLDGPLVRESLSRNDWDFDDFFKKPTLFIIKAELNRPDMAILASLFIRMLQLRNYAYAERCKGDPEGPRPIWYYLDEFAHLNLPDIHKFATTIRSSRGGLVIMVQDADDLREYMKKFRSGSPKALESSLRTVIVLPGCHQDMCKEISEIAGKTVFMQSTRTRGVFDMFRFDYRENAELAPLLTPDSIHYMKKDMCLIMSREVRPFWAKQIPYFTDLKLRMLLNKPFNYYMPGKIVDVAPGKIDKLLRERASDIQEHIKNLGKGAEDAMPPADMGIDLSRDDRPSPQAGNAKRFLDAKQLEDLEKQKDKDGQQPKNKPDKLGDIL